MKEKSKFQQLTRLAEDLSTPDPQNPNELRESLELEGVDVDDYLSRMGKVFRTRFQECSKQLKSEQSRTSQPILTKIASWSREQLEEKLERAKSGLLGADAQAMADACYRNKQPGELEVEELRSLVGDILASECEE